MSLRRRCRQSSRPPQTESAVSEPATGDVPGIMRRVFSMLYEATLLFAVAFIATWLFQFAAGGAVVTGLAAHRAAVLPGRGIRRVFPLVLAARRPDAGDESLEDPAGRSRPHPHSCAHCARTSFAGGDLRRIVLRGPRRRVHSPQSVGRVRYPGVFGRRPWLGPFRPRPPVPARQAGRHPARAGRSN